MKKKTWIKIASASLGALVASSIIAGSVLGTKQNYNNESNEIKESILLDSTETEDGEGVEYKTINNIKIPFPNLGGPKSLKVIQNSTFNPKLYAYYVYDQLDNDRQAKAEYDLSGINTANLGKQTFTMSYTNLYGLNVSKTFEIEVVSEAEYNNQMVFTYNPYVNNADIQFLKRSEGHFGIDHDWQLAVPVFVRKGDKFIVKQTESPKIASVYLSIAEGTPATNGQYTNNGSFVPLDQEYTAKHDGFLLINTPETKYKRQTADVVITFTHRTYPTKHVKVPVYFHNATSPEDFLNEWLAIKGFGALAMNNAFTWPLTSQDRGLFLYDSRNAINTKNLIDRSNAQEKMLKFFRDHVGLGSELTSPTNLQVNTRILTIGHGSGSTTVAFVSNWYLALNIRGGHASVAAGTEDSGVMRHELGHLYQGSYKFRKYGMTETSNIFPWFALDWTNNYNWRVNEYKKTNPDAEITLELKKKFEQDAWRSISYVSAFANWNTGANILATNKIYTDQIYRKLDPYDALRQYIYTNLFNKTGWDAWTDFNQNWRKITSDLLPDSPVNKFTPNSEAMYYYFGHKTGYDISQYMESVGLKIDHRWLVNGVYNGWKPIGTLNDIIPQYSNDLIKKLDLINAQSLVDNDQLPKDKLGSIKININNIDLEKIKGERIKVIDNAGGKYHVLTEKTIDSLTVEINDIPVGSYLIQLPPSKTDASFIYPFPALSSLDKTNVYDVSYLFSTPAKVTGKGIVADRPNSTNNFFKAFVQDNRLTLESMWDFNHKIMDAWWFNEGYPADDKEFLSYKLYDDKGHEVILQRKLPAHANGVEGKVFYAEPTIDENTGVITDNKPYENYTYVKSTSEKGEIEKSAIVDTIDLDFSNNKKYKLEVFLQESRLLKMYNPFNGDRLTNQNTWTNWSNRFGSTQNYDSSHWNAANWNESLRKQKTVTYTVSANGIELGYEDNLGTYVNKTNNQADANAPLTNVGYSDDEKQKIIDVEKNIFFNYIKTQYTFMKSIKAEIIKVRSNLYAEKISLQNFINAVTTPEYNWDEEQRNYLNEVKSFLDSVLVVSNLRKSENNPPKMTLPISTTNVWASIYAQNKYFDEKDDEHQVDITNLKHTNIPFNGNGNISRPGIYFAEFEVRKDQSTITWRVEVEIR